MIMVILSGKIKLYGNELFCADIQHTYTLCGNLTDIDMRVRLWEAEKRYATLYLRLSVLTGTKKISKAFKLSY